MASNGYPKVPLKAWRALRARAASAPSTKFTAPTVAALMGMSSPASAANNTVLPMRRLGLLDDEGALTPRGNKWRVDTTYSEACQEILDDVYPPDLLALTDDAGAPDPQRVRTWFDHKGYGASNARQMASTYVMISTKKPPEAAVSEPANVRTKKGATKKAPAVSGRTPSPDGGAQATRKPDVPAGTNGTGPNVHLDIQIHIPANASPGQIDQIFESMARHLYKQ